jgi:hypothetical protein
MPTVDSHSVSRSGILTNNSELTESPKKRQRREDDTAASSLSYWPFSPEAYHFLFKPRSGTGNAVGGSDRGSTSATSNESPQEALERRIQILQSVHKSEDSWRNVIIGRDADNFCTKAEIFEIRQRAIFLCRAYQLALKHMNNWTWYKCCPRGMQSAQQSWHVASNMLQDCCKLEHNISAA